MELISQAFLRPLTPRDTGMVDIRKMLRNIPEYAVSAWFNSLEATIASLPIPPPRTRSPKRADTMSNPAAPVGHPLATAPRLDVQPLTPELSSSPFIRLREE
ncbi:hypothetical protein K505DRAFT_366742 [Melanomma pulvis-pyrius CBS 109.77]|uniref:Uncharacterized protein n=1 Tax=Melanomma pulvis-pyrius CBS 109.77 TaxID=1314802 RepID=A0A6A6WWK9_9PLEO|nr:hypothetical protein K505DRAFT_366742 [Melanomma pulvis-pyrius CBS 109.77]